MIKTMTMKFSIALSLLLPGQYGLAQDAPAPEAAANPAATVVLDKVVSVLDFGAVGDGITDDTAAIQRALDAAKGADGDGKGRTVFSLYIPSIPGGFYKITDTLVINGTHGLLIYGDGALTERESNNATIRWYGTESKPVFQVKGTTGIPSNPNFYITFRDLTISGHRTYLRRDEEPPRDLALSGIHFGILAGEDDSTLCRRAICQRRYTAAGRKDGVDA